MLRKIFSAVLLILVLTACKPTENNYKAAYDAARNHRTAVADADIDTSLMVAEDAPKPVVVNGDTVPVRHMPLKMFFPQDQRLADCYVAVAIMNMPTNAKAMASDLREAGFDACVLMNTDEQYIVTSASAATLEEAADLRRQYMKARPKSPSLGLPSGPIVILR